MYSGSLSQRRANGLPRHYMIVLMRESLLCLAMKIEHQPQPFTIKIINNIEYTNSAPIII